MPYLINIAMVYDSDASIIKIKGEEDRCVRLSGQASRLLHELIISNNHALERNYLIFKVWEQYGYPGSSISLNVAVCELRKAFRQLNGDPMIIKTLRGIGFMLSADIDHFDAEHTCQNSERPKEPQPPGDALESGAGCKITQHHCRHWSFAVAGICALLTAAVAGVLMTEIEWSSFTGLDANFNRIDEDVTCSLLEQDKPLKD